MANSSQLIQYFRDCYEADNRETGIANLFSSKYRHVSFLSGSDDLLWDVLNRVPIDRGTALAAQKEAELYRKDKTLVYCAFPLVGQSGGVGQLPKQLCAPLVFFPATITDENGVAFLSVDLTQQRVNFPVLAALAGESEQTRSLAEDLLGQIPQAPFRTEDIHSLISLLMDFLPGIEALSLAGYPKLVEEKQVRRTMQAGKNDDTITLSCLPACAVALMPNSPSTRGVLFELAEMSDGRPLSAPVRLLLQDPNPVEDTSQKADTGRVPAVLSHSQQKILASAGSHPLTLVVGPPGTGKSYTVAALALDHLSRGESVLVASRMNHAVDVVAGKIENMIGPGPYVIRGGRKQYLRDLKKFLQQILHGIVRQNLKAIENPRHLSNKLAAVDRKIARLEGILQKQSGWAKQWGSEVESPGPQSEYFPVRYFQNILGKWKLRLLEWQLGGARPLWKSTEKYHHALEERSRLITELLQETAAGRIQQMLEHNRRDLSKFLKSIRSRSDVKQEQLFSEISLEVLFGTFPIWLTTIADVSEVLPLKPEMFDLVVIDEATQCDISSCLPVLQRARRAVIVGDPNQLRHVSFLSRQRQQSIGEQNELDRTQQDLFPYREKSILDLLGDTISTQQQVLFLEEHYRSMPQIINFSNDEFYAGSLKVMTQRPETVDLQCVRLRYIPDGQKVRGMNDREARALVDEVVARIEAEKEMPQEVCHSLGVLSPFRDQVDHIFSLLEERLPLDAINKHNLMVGTAHTFQGEERDAMYLSLVVDRDTHPASFRFINNPNIFNVSITRARNEQYVFCSIKPDDLCGDTLVRRYLASIDRGPIPSSTAHTGPPDDFLRKVRDELQQRGFRAWPAYPVAGMKIDLAVEQSGKTLGIDLIGYPGEFAEAFDLERYRMLQRAGLLLFPLSYYAWQKDKDACLDAISHWHKRLHN
ncbi:MAG: hypothetical protein JXM70_05650 [Pirellulales bacterium]|nr:hypothetical protein [Pirellulales bacterium]